MTLPDELLEVTPDEFVATRDAMSKRLRAEGDKVAADEVKRARKPSISVWALDNLARRRPERMAAVLDAGDTLRRAQEELQADELRKGTGLLRDAIAATVDEAAALAGERGVKVPPAQRERMRDTLFAAATTDGEERELLRFGRLLEDLESIGFVGSVSASAAQRPAAPDPTAEARRRVGEAEVAAKEAADAARRARRQADELERQAEEARLRATNLEEEAERASAEAAQLEEAAAGAEAELEEARADLS